MPGGPWNLCAAMLMAAFATASSRFGWPRPAAWVVPLVAYVVGLALVWSPLDLASVEDARRPEVVIGLFARDHWARVVVGIGLAFSAMWWFATWHYTDQPVVRLLMVPPALVAARSIMSTMWLTCVAWLRATKVAPLLSSVRIGLIGWSIAPHGSVFDLKPMGEVGEVCFLVRP